MELKPYTVGEIHYFCFQFKRNDPEIEIFTSFIDSIKRKYEGRLDKLLDYTRGELEVPFSFDAGIFKFTQSIILFSKTSGETGHPSYFANTLFSTIHELFPSLVSAYSEKEAALIISGLVERIYDLRISELARGCDSETKLGIG